MSVAAALAAALGRARRVPRVGFTRLTTKQAPIGYYKGKGASPSGRHTSKGGYIGMEEKKPQYVVPDLTGFKLKPFVANTIIKPSAAAAT
ncbi:39S ribosomal L41-mitochondrial-like [Micractinium conductrix]|uniref:39S ribosomal L41-mitochondrial-like n=1 Tax=Micractinium conductrix TaxID=554055 RepID=A0A2P6VP75_9CHLO|nr:39S ribosomal L41-mitochondrial-like [Micractinium conductrix]|eukprot:PSC75865.1 39S ribosomal L41-mitochondrial-like [Micractinium conductrix]